jgi:hypothetical protein
MPIHAAGHRPVTMMLAQTTSQRLTSCRNRHPSSRPRTKIVTSSAAPTPSRIVRDPVRRHHSHHRPRRNHHSARRKTTRHLPRFPSLEAFGRRPPEPADPSVRGRHPKPFTHPEMLMASTSSPVHPQLRKHRGVAANRRCGPPRDSRTATSRSGCFRLERLPGGTCTHWQAPPFHGGCQQQTLGVSSDHVAGS